MRTTIEVRCTNMKHGGEWTCFHPKIPAAIPYKVVEHNLTVMNNNLNNVDIDKEMANLADLK